MLYSNEIVPVITLSDHYLVDDNQWVFDFYHFKSKIHIVKHKFELYEISIYNYQYELFAIAGNLHAEIIQNTIHHLLLKTNINDVRFLNKNFPL